MATTKKTTKKTATKKTSVKKPAAPRWPSPVTPPKPAFPVQPYVRGEHLVMKLLDKACPGLEAQTVLDVGGAEAGIGGIELWQARGVEPVGTYGNDVAGSYDVVQAFHTLGTLGTKADLTAFLRKVETVANHFAVVGCAETFWSAEDLAAQGWNVYRNGGKKLVAWKVPG